MAHYGTLGGRSRNGWGSFTLEAGAGEPPALDGAPDPALLRLWSGALDRDWPHAIGRDERGPLIWQIDDVLGDWKAAMRRLAEIKIALRTQFPFTTGRNATRPEARHWLSYPVTKHNVADWREGAGATCACPTAFASRSERTRTGGSAGRSSTSLAYRPPQFRPDRRVIEGVWQRVHAFLDAPAQQLSRIPQ